MTTDRAHDASSVGDEIVSLRVKGYVLIPNVFGSAEIADALVRVRRVFEAAPSANSGAKVPFLNKGQSIIYNLQNKDFGLLEMLFASLRVRDILHHFLNDQWYKQIPAENANYILRSYLARSSVGALPLHLDSFVPYLGDHVFGMQCSIILEDSSEENGCTIFVPGSHNVGRYARPSDLQFAVPLPAKSGDVVIWDSRTWHGTTENRTGESRWALIATFTRWWLKQAFDITGNLPQEFYERLTDEQKSVMGYCCLPCRNEDTSLDMKQGYDSLKADVSLY